MAKFATVLLLALVAYSAHGLSLRTASGSGSSSAQAVVTVCRNLESNCKNNCTDYTVPADGSCWPIPDSKISMEFSCDTSVQCLNVTEYLLSPTCSGYHTKMTNYLGSQFLTEQCSYWAIENQTVSHGINCENPNTGMCDSKYCSTVYQGQLGTCSNQPVLGLNSSYSLDALTDCGSFPSSQITFWASDKCKSEGGQTTTHKHIHSPMCGELLPYAKATFQYKCQRSGGKMPPAAPQDVLTLLAKYHMAEAAKNKH